jgi:hypothetical protein
LNCEIIDKSIVDPNLANKKFFLDLETKTIKIEEYNYVYNLDDYLLELIIDENNEDIK